MKTRPIIFNGEMVRAILDGRKTQTRRVIKPMRGRQSEWLTVSQINNVKNGRLVNGGWQMYHPRAGTVYLGVNVADDSPYGWIRCPYGQPGDLLWVRETWMIGNYSDCSPANIAISYRAGGQHKRIYTSDLPSRPSVIAKKCHFQSGKWRPSIYMPRWASRITLRVLDVRVERVQDISSQDASSEGYPKLSPTQLRGVSKIPFPKKWFGELWDSINAQRGYGWDVNPWVWVVEFEVMQ